MEKMDTLKLAVPFTPPSPPIVEAGKKSERHQNPGGLGWFVTGLFVIGDLAGGGVVAFPTAIVQTDFYPGLVITVVMTAVMTYSAYLLGLSWVILQRRWPEYRDHCRNPYPEMGGRAMGPTMKLIVSLCIDLTQFGIAIVYLLLSSKNIHDFLRAFFNSDFSFCYVILIVGVCLLPIIFLKSPQDFWWAVVVAMITTSCAVVLIIIGSIIDFETCASHQGVNDKFVPSNYFLALGTFLFAYGGHSAFPTIQHDMQKPYHFTRSSIMAFAIIAIMYTSVSILSYIVYGNSLQDSIINSIQTTGIQQAVNILITVHCILTLTIVMNPLSQEIEEIFHVPHHFCWQRAAVRTGLMAAVIFVSESLPTFGPLLDLVGGSTITLAALIFPCLFYLFLKAGEQKSREKDNPNADEPPSFMEVITRLPVHQLIICLFIMLFGVIGGSAATYSALKGLATTHFTLPCYLQPFLNASYSTDTAQQTNCCGAFQNVSRYGDSFVCNNFKDFYSQY